MNNKITIIMYHYVRNMELSINTNIKGLDIKFFNEQLIYLKRHYTFIKVEELIDIITNNLALPKNICILTFDDGYIDHFQNVLPILEKYNLQGLFYPPINAIFDNIVLDVNKIHFILSKMNVQTIIKDIFEQINIFRQNELLDSNEFYYNKFAHASRYDDKNIIFIKRILQHGLPDYIRKSITNKLFNKYVTADETSFANELYMTKDHLTYLISRGMHIGSHGLNHIWLGNVNYDIQNFEIQQSKSKLLSIGVNADYLTISYPYGSYNKDTIKISGDSNFKLGFTTEVNTADLSNNFLSLPRLNTNDIPKNSKSKPNSWY